jgi:hypothetical protein
VHLSLDSVHVLARLLGGARLAAEKAQVTEDAGEGIAHLVCDAGGQTSHRGQSLGRNQLLLGAGDVLVGQAKVLQLLVCQGALCLEGRRRPTQGGLDAGQERASGASRAQLEVEPLELAHLRL